MKSAKFISLAVAIFLFLGVDAQYNKEFGFKLGGTNYLGEIGGKEKSRRDFIMDMKLSQTRWVAGGYFRYTINNSFGASGSINYGQITGDDALSTNDGRKWRNLRFKNNILEINARGEYNFFQVSDVGGRGRYSIDMRAYAHAGLTGFMHNPKGNNGNGWVALQPLQTEGIAYSKWGLGVPTGVGVYFTYKRKHRIGWDVTWTTTFTDYLDDISTTYVAGLSPEVEALANQSAAVTPEAAMGNFVPGEKRGDPTHNDTYMFTTLSYGYLIRSKGGFYRQSYGWLSGKKSRVRKVRAKF